MAITAKKKARLRDQAATAQVQDVLPVQTEKQCTCLVSIRGRGQHAIDCPLYGE